MNANPKDPMTKLIDTHNLDRWRICEDGYRWRITFNGSAYTGELTDGDGRPKGLWTHPSRGRVEFLLTKRLAHLRGL